MALADRPGRWVGQGRLRSLAVLPGRRGVDQATGEVGYFDQSGLMVLELSPYQCKIFTGGREGLLVVGDQRGGRSAGCVESLAGTVSEVIAETAVSRLTERGATRADDRISEAGMEDRKREGYF